MNININTNVVDVIKLLADSQVQIKLDDEDIAVSAEKGRMSPELLEQLTVHKQALITHLKQTSLAEPKIDSVCRDQKIALSFAQQRLWLLDQIDGGSSHYNMPDALRLKGALDLRALKKAFNEILARHECLRTRFKKDESGEPFQAIQEQRVLDIEVRDLSDFDQIAKDQLLAEIVEREAETLFDLAKDFMLRAALVKLAPQEHVLLVTTHHIASDGWSRAIIVDEFSILYDAFKEGQESPLTPLTIQYADYAHWQRQWLKGELLERQLGYWEKQLANLPAVHSLPLDRARPENQTFNGNVVTRSLNKERSQAFNGICHNQGVTLFMGLHAVLGVLLARHSNESDIVVGTLIANREQPEISNLIGFFANSLVLRSDLSAKPSFTELLQQSKRILLEAYEHQQVPFEKIVERLQPERDLAFSPLYQIVLVLQNNEVSSVGLSGLSMESLGGDAQSVARYDITLDITESKDGLILNWGYNKDLFDEATIELLAEHYENLFDAVLVDPKQNLFSVDIVTSRERQLLLNEWNSIDQVFDADVCIHELFERHANRHPDATALVFDGQEMSYGELNRKANKLASYLVHEKGIKPDQLIGICLDRSFEMLISILAVLKAGGAYLPLDPKYPESRLKYMVDDAELRTILTTCEQLDSHGFMSEVALCLNDQSFIKSLKPYCETDIDRTSTGLNASHLAYVIYTSGSTGVPKGVMVEHNNVARLLASTQDHFDFDCDDVWCLFHSFSFDFSVWEIWGALAYGGRLVVIPHSLTRSTSELYQLLQDEKVTVLNQTPSAFNAFIDEDLKQQAQLDLRYVVFGGEALNFSALRPWVEVHGDSSPELINMYGITETTVHVTFRKLNRRIIFDDNAGSQIGESLSDLRILILDDQKKLTPIGVAGEIYVGGAGVARGYLNASKENDARFLSLESFADLRLYRSGDLARYLPNGELEHLGRIDSQVKLRGFRIELGEIEAQLLGLQGVARVAVLCHGAGDEQHLVAYVVLTDSAIKPDDLDQEDIDYYIDSLKASLPEFMIPSNFVVLKALPLDNNGKLDRERLPKPNFNNRKTEFVAPRNNLEEALVTAWRSILSLSGVDSNEIGVHDNFFQLGGNSLLVVRLASCIRDIGYNVSVRDIVQSPTVSGIAQKIDSVSAGNDLIESSQRTSSSTKGICHVTPSQAWMLNQGTLYNQHMFKDIIFDIHEQIDIDLLNDTVAIILNTHDALRSCFVKDNEQWKALIAEKGEHSRVVVEDLSGIERSKQIEKSCFDFLTQFKKSVDIYKGPVFAVAYIRLPNGIPDRLCFSTHHLVYDGYSLDVIFKDFHDVYESLNKGVAPKLPVTASIADVADWTSDAKNSQMLFDATSAWLQDVKTSLMPLDINKEGDRKALNTFSSSESLVKSLTLDSKQVQTEGLSSVAKIALVNALAKWSGHKQIELIEISALRYDLAVIANLDLSRTVGLISGAKIQVLQPMTEDSNESRHSSLQQQIEEMPYGGMFLRDVGEFVDHNGRLLIQDEIKFNLQVSSTEDEEAAEKIVLDFRTDAVAFEGSDSALESNSEALRAGLFEVNVSLDGVHMDISWTYSKNLHRQATIESLLTSFISEIETMMAA